MTRCLAYGLFLALTVLICAQIQPTFEVASIKRAPPNAFVSSVRPGPDRLSFTNITLMGMIAFAFTDELGSNPPIVGGPSWIDRARFDLEAVASERTSQTELRAMLRNLLAERFHLKDHREVREENVYALVPARRDNKLGAKVMPWAGDCGGRAAPPAPSSTQAPRCAAFYRSPGLTLEGGSFAVLADMLSMKIMTGFDCRVIDRTGIPGEFNLILEYEFPVRPLDDTTGPSLFTAIQEQLGLKLESAKGSVTYMVVDNAEPPTEN